MKQCTYVDYDLYSPVSITIDRQFIVIKSYVSKEPEDDQLVAHFISTETLVTRKSLTVDAQLAVYDKGLLYVLHNGHARIYDVSSGTFIRDLPLRSERLKNVDSERFLVSANSKYVAIYYVHRYPIRNELSSESMLRIYDLEALKNPDADPNSLLLTKIENQSNGVSKMTMNETRIIFYSKLLEDCDYKHEVFELDFSPRQLSTNFQNGQFLKRIWQLRTILGSASLFCVCNFVF
jgi:hypothetical protein